MYVESETIDGRTGLGTGAIIAYENMPLKFKIGSPREPEAEPLSLIVAFKTDKNIKDPQVQTKLEDRLLTITFVNYDNILGTGSTKPIYLGDNPFADLYGHFRVYGFGDIAMDGDKVLQYTFYEIDKPKPSKIEKKHDGKR